MKRTLVAILLVFSLTGRSHELEQTALRDSIVRFAESYLGTPYLTQALLKKVLTAPVLSILYLIILE
ncbi:MAG: hypothetical protein IPO32_14525 [Crocinitomicaceae bacterium]|nr:hypothetical protein [Crocinitomicaceae bacterium]